jgi:PIN like domain
VPRPEFLLDRSLGRHQIADALRAKGLVVHTLWSVYGRSEERLGDDVWIAEAGMRGWPILSADKRLRYDVGTRLLAVHRAAVFQLARGSLPGRLQVRWFLNNLESIQDICEQEPRPFLYSVYEHQVERIWP